MRTITPGCPATTSGGMAASTEPEPINSQPKTSRMQPHWQNPRGKQKNPPNDSGWLSTFSLNCGLFCTWRNCVFLCTVKTKRFCVAPWAAKCPKGSHSDGHVEDEVRKPDRSPDEEEPRPNPEGFSLIQTLLDPVPKSSILLAADDFAVLNFYFSIIVEENENKNYHQN